MFPIGNNIAAYHCPYEYYSRTVIISRHRKGVILEGGINSPADIGIMVRRKRKADGLTLTDAAAIKQNLVLKILSDMIQNIVPKAEKLAAEFYDNYGTDGTIEKICSVIRKRAHKIG
jgi:hypothetical protein